MENQSNSLITFHSQLKTALTRLIYSRFNMAAPDFFFSDTKCFLIDCKLFSLERGEIVLIFESNKEAIVSFSMPFPWVDAFSLLRPELSLLTRLIRIDRS